LAHSSAMILFVLFLFPSLVVVQGKLLVSWPACSYLHA
jgi:hypothetical protein